MWQYHMTSHGAAARPCRPLISDSLLVGTFFKQFSVIHIISDLLSVRFCAPSDGPSRLLLGTFLALSDYPWA